MIGNHIFLVAAGKIPDDDLESGYIALSAFWSRKLKIYSCLDSPNKVLNELKEADELVLLKGDVAEPHPENPSWIESLGDWKKPIILLVTPKSCGGTPGVALAYTALCKQFSVPLIGTVQLGGPWIVEKKRFDNLPWCGWLPSSEQENMNLERNFSSIYQIDTPTLVENLRKRCCYLGCDF